MKQISECKRVAIVAFSGVVIAVLCMILSVYESEKDIRYDESLQDQFVEIARDGILNLNIDFENLLRRNPDTVGWIYIPGTNINYPVVQCENNYLYLEQRFDGSATPYGTVFADHRNNLEKSNNVILYGHNQGPLNPVKFTQLTNYVSESDFIENHSYFEFYDANTGKGKVFKVFSIIQADVTTQENIDMYYLERKDQESYQSYLNWLQKQSLIKCDAPINSSKQAMILSTCSDQNDWQRVLVCGIEI